MDINKVITKSGYTDPSSINEVESGSVCVFIDDHRGGLMWAVQADNGVIAGKLLSSTGRTGWGANTDQYYDDTGTPIATVDMDDKSRRTMKAHIQKDEPLTSEETSAIIKAINIKK